jgi:hypothetical protein
MVSLFFLDSSALVKRYVTEVGSDWIRSLTHPSTPNQLIIARITWVEVLSALARRRREGSVAADDVAQAMQAFRYDLDMQYQIVELDAALADTAGDLVAQHPLRAYDAVQLASALQIERDLVQAEMPTLIFLTADERLAEIARAEDLLTDNPNQHL